MLNKGLFTSLKQSYATPKALYDALNEEFHFDDDPCPLSEPSPLYSNDGLARAWGNSVFINPPYGREISKWIERAYREAQGGGKTIVLLIPSRTDTRWWHSWIMKATEIRFLRGRLCFDGKSPAPFPSAVVVFKSL